MMKIWKNMNTIEHLKTVTFKDLEQILKKGESAMYKVNGLMRKQALGLKYDQCDFEAINSNCPMMHKKAKHTD